MWITWWQRHRNSLVWIWGSQSLFADVNIAWRAVLQSLRGHRALHWQCLNCIKEVTRAEAPCFDSWRADSWFFRHLGRPWESVCSSRISTLNECTGKVIKNGGVQTVIRKPSPSRLVFVSCFPAYLCNEVLFLGTWWIPLVESHSIMGSTYLACLSVVSVITSLAWILYLKLEGSHFTFCLSQSSSPYSSD